MTDLEKYVITYENDEGGIICNIPAYYDLRVKPLGAKFEQYDFETSHTVICPLHDDHDPSLGLMRDKNISKVMLYHCLGCGSVGNVVRLHQRVESKYSNRELSLKDACIELCEIFGIPLPEDSIYDEDDLERRQAGRLHKIDELQGVYTINEFKRELLNMRKLGVDLNKINSSCVKMIATEKGLYY